ncbi:MAG: pilus assembly protein CpaE [Acidobacteria bacterium]|nr:MAG: pilus assembly protein CpaE [Acidobacteriota bacterium]
MSSVIVASDSADLVRRVRLATTDEVLVISPEHLPPSPSEVLLVAHDHGEVRALVVDPPEGRLGEVLRLATAFFQAHPAVSVLLVTQHKEDLALPALRAGVRDLVYHDASVGDLRWALEKARRGEDLRLGRGALEGSTVPGRVITVSGAKGGVGKTALAVNLALALTTAAPHGTALLDLDVQFGDVRAALSIEPSTTLVDAARRGPGEERTSLRSLLVRHTSGLQVLAGALSPVDGDEVGAEATGQVLQDLRSEFQYVVVDTAAGLTEHTLAALEHTTDLVLVTTADVPSVRALHRQLEAFNAMPAPRPASHLVVNLLRSSSTVSVKDVERAVGRRADVVLPRASRAAAASPVGVPLIRPGDRDKLTRSVMSLMSRVTPAPAGKARR